jgi:hypothetical protein
MVNRIFCSSIQLLVASATLIFTLEDLGTLPICGTTARDVPCNSHTRSPLQVMKNALPGNPRRCAVNLVCLAFFFLRCTDRSGIEATRVQLSTNFCRRARSTSHRTIGPSRRNMAKTTIPIALMPERRPLDARINARSATCDCLCRVSSMISELARVSTTYPTSTWCTIRELNRLEKP